MIWITHVRDAAHNGPQRLSISAIHGADALRLDVPVSTGDTRRCISLCHLGTKAFNFAAADGRDPIARTQFPHDFSDVVLDRLFSQR